MTYWSRQTVDFADSANLDAFGRLRVSNPTTLFDSKQLYDSATLFWDEVQGGGAAASTHSTADAATTMTVDAAGEYLIRQTKMRMNYQPGKSQQVMMTFVLGTATTNVDKKIGYYNSATTGDYDTDLDGIYLKQDGTTQYVCVSKSGTETAVAQASWNLDAMDGNGPSGVTLDWTKTQIMIVDFEWLGVGRVRFGWNVDGKNYYCHEFRHANAETSVYMSSPNHSARHEIRSAGGTASLVHICTSIASEGGEQELGVLRSTSTSDASITATSAGTVYAVRGYRLRSTHLDATVNLIDFSLAIHSSSHQIEWSIVLNPTLTGSIVWTGLTESAVEEMSGQATVTGGITLKAGFLNSAGNQGGGAGTGSGGIPSALRVGSQIDGTRDTLILCAMPVNGSSNVDVEGSMLWRESS